MLGVTGHEVNCNSLKIAMEMPPRSCYNVFNNLQLEMA